MQTYEINLWQDKKVIEKVVKQFDNDEKVLEFIKEHILIKKRNCHVWTQKKGIFGPKRAI
jgi:hypothetical protein